MKTFKNKNFTKRDYETTNIVFCQSEIAPDENFIECNDFEIELLNCKQLYIENEIKYFGYL